MSPTTFSRPARLLPLLLLAACGGGSGGSGDSQPTTLASDISMSYSPSAINLSLLEGNQSPSTPDVTVTATATNLPAGQIYPRILEDEAVLATGAHSVFRNLDGSFRVTLPFDRHLPVGTHAGKFTLQLCADAGCSSIYAFKGSTLPYSVTVVPGIKLTATANGQPVTLPVTVKDGAVVSIQASMPVSWGSSSSGGRADNTSFTDTSWTGTIRYSVSTHGSSGSYSVFAEKLSQPQGRVEALIVVTE